LNLKSNDLNKKQKKQKKKGAKKNNRPKKRFFYITIPNDVQSIVVNVTKGEG